MDPFEKALQSLPGNQGPASPSQNAGGTTPGPDQPQGAPAPAAPAPVSTSFDIDDQVPLSDTLGAPLSDEEQQDLAAQAAAEAAANGGAQGDGTGTNNPPPPAGDGAFNEEEFFSGKSGGKFKTWDEINAAITKPAEKVIEIKAPEFVNDDARKLYEAIVAGKVDEVLPVLQQRQFIQTLATRQPEEILAARIREQYPSLTNEQVQYEINKRYSVKEADFENDEMGLSVAQTMASDRKAADAKEAVTYFSNKLSDLKLPDLVPAGQQVPQPDTTNLETPEAIKALAFINQLPPAQTVEKLSFTHKSDSEVNPITVAGDILLPQDKIAEIKDAIGDRPDLYMLNRFFTKDGEFLSDLFAQWVYKNENLTAILQQAAGKSLDQTQIEMLKRAKNYAPDRQTPGGGFDQAASDANREQLERFFGIPPKQPGSVV